MSDLHLIEAVKTGQLAKVEQALNSGADIHQQDEQGWTPLNWAAGKGDVEIVKLLLDRGADALRVGRDQRTPYKIALAAKHVDVAHLLRDAERAGGTNGDSSNRNYARAYLLGDLRRFSGWREEKINRKEPAAGENGNSPALTDSDVVFLHHDFSVTELIWPGENVIFNHDTPEWREFCTQELQFRVPDDFDLIAASTTDSPVKAASALS
jgi:ankyrin repeat protein